MASRKGMQFVDDEMTRMEGAEQAPDEKQPIYRVYKDSKIPVARSYGALWKSRHEAGRKMRDNRRDTELWKEAICYFRNEQRRAYGTPIDGQPVALDQYPKTTENVVFPNVMAMAPALYAQNPTVEFTAVDTQDEAMARVLERLVNELMRRKAAPGVSVKSKARRCVVATELTNMSYIEVGYTQRDASREAALEELMKLSDELQKADSQKKVREVEGKLIALEKRVDFVRPSGPWCAFRSCMDVYVDPDAKEVDLTDAQWVIIEDMVSTDFIKAAYGYEDVKGEIRSVYAPTHVVGGGTSVEDEIANFSLLTNAEYTNYGYTDQHSFDRAQRTRVAYVWDATTRRVFMYNTQSWTWPIWVWDDPYHFDTFFPLVPLVFNIDPERGAGRSSVTYYLDQQDQINAIDSELSKARKRLMNKYIYDEESIVDRESVERLLNSTDDTAVGVRLPDGRKIADVFQAVVPPSLQHPELLDKAPLYQAIDRLSGIPEVMRGVQFKTNTTNEAIGTYTSIAEMRIGDRVDAVEDMIGQVGWMLAQLCLQFMPAEQVQTVIGPVEGWTNMVHNEIAQHFQAQVQGGSSVKPTSQAKQEKAIEVGQVLGQFASVSPVVVLIMLRMFQRAFDEVVVFDDDWKMIMASIQQQLAGGGAEGEAAPATPTPTEQPLPPEVERAVELAVQRGVPREEAIARVQELASSNGAVQ